MSGNILRLPQKTIFELVRHVHILKHRYLYWKLARDHKPFHFTCNICENRTEGLIAEIYDRDKDSCQHCGASLRYRTIIHLLSIELYGKSIPLPQFEEKKDLIGIGMSDWGGYAELLAQKFSYTNTFYHKPPLLDITAPPKENQNRFDFIITSDVFEHILPPIDTAFKNMAKLLRPNGLCLITVPYMHFFNTWEHFPQINNFEIISPSTGDPYLLNETKGRKQETHNNLVFHGGKGATLEMRVFSKNSLQKHLENAGFHSIQFHKCNFPEYGICWPLNWSLPISARV